MGKDTIQRLTPDGRDYLEHYPFPGNVRELKNLCRRLTIFHPKGPLTITTIQSMLDTSKIDVDAHHVI